MHIAIAEDSGNRNFPARINDGWFSSMSDAVAFLEKVDDPYDAFCICRSRFVIAERKVDVGKCLPAAWIERRSPFVPENLRTSPTVCRPDLADRLEALARQYRDDSEAIEPLTAEELAEMDREIAENERQGYGRVVR